MFPANLFVDDARNFFGDLVADVVRPVDLVGDPPEDDLGDVGLAHRGGLVEHVCKQKRKSRNVKVSLDIEHALFFYVKGAAFGDHFGSQ